MKVAKIKNYLNQLNWLLVIVTLLVFVGLIKLGLWQTERAVEKESRIERISQFQSRKALTVDQVIVLAQTEDINDVPITLNGSFDENVIFLLDNQTNKGRVGYRVLQMFSVNSHQVLINMGWIPAGVYRDDIPVVEALSGEYQLKGNVRLIERGIRLEEDLLEPSQWPLRVQHIELDNFSQIIGQKLLPFVVYLDKTEDIGFVKNWQPIVMPPEKHRGYAFQWFSLATAWLALMFSASVWFFKNKNQE